MRENSDRPHSGPPIFEEMVMDANRAHGRPAERPILFEDGIDRVLLRRVQGMS